MDQILLSLPTPVRAIPTDDPEEILSFAAAVLQKGGEVALATLVDIRGGAARSLGSQLAVASDGRFCGYVSGGCVEAAVASEALVAIAERRDRMIRYGEGSPFFDIVLPCGGGITIALHVVKDGGLINGVLEGLRQRRRTALCYHPAYERLRAVDPPSRSGWNSDEFISLYRPRTRIVISGQTLEARAVASVANASGYDAVWREEAMNGEDTIDEATAAVVLHHDLDAEDRVLRTALQSPAFYIGALGSTRTHRRREERLRASGWSKVEIDRIKAPIGFFGPTRDASSLALSVLADVAAARLAVHG
ncbi:XdhC family protein [Rhizobium sp. CF142]|uniref:XdhC family protein n=1 Tax=Rhizobium sp. CF142 TaxID=1144314 RepID=UPI00026F04EC|nr:XdhC family protein [Rhizobium sp. CF142]EJJ26171.1 xanthine and CO dehydrogenases maturation factor, XdhC/CoxF family [Rhizobium sp. CF142]